MNRGEIWLAIWPADPSKKSRLVLIVSNNIKNSTPQFHDINVVKITSLERSNGSKKPVNLAEDVVITLKKESVIKCGSIYIIEKAKLQKKIANVSGEDMLKVDDGLRNTLCL